jgi:Type I restriction-modification system methyltransferase subunit
MKHEKVTDTIVTNMLQKCGYVDGNFCDIGDTQTWIHKSENSAINNLLSKASKSGKGNIGYPEFIILDRGSNLVVVIEDKRDTKFHIYKVIEERVDEYAVNGALWYASFLKESYDVIAVGVSGNDISNIIIDSYFWKKGVNTFSNMNVHEIQKITKYRDLINKSSRNIHSSDEIKLLADKAKEINIFLRSYLGVQEHKRLYVLGSILFALEDPVFKMAYSSYSNNSELSEFLFQTLDRKTKNSGLKHANVIQNELKPCIEGLANTEKKGVENKYPNGTLFELIKDIDGVLFEYYKNSELDLISIFFNVFLSFATKGGSDLGIVLTPSHITKLFCDMVDVNLESRILDPCVGTGGFLTAAWKKISLSNLYSFSEKENFRKNNIYGVEKDPGIYTIAALNMFINKDGRSNLYNRDCFALKKELKSNDCTIGFINPPYSDDVYPEIEFVEFMLDSLLPGSIGVAIVPVNAVSSRTKKHSGIIEIKRRILQKNRLLASIQMPVQLFYPKGTETIVLVFETGITHNGRTWFAEYDDGYVLQKHRKMRIPGPDSEIKYSDILHAFKERKETSFSFLKEVTCDDQWVYTLHKLNEYKVTSSDLQKTVNDYFSYLVQNRYPIMHTEHLFVDKPDVVYGYMSLTDYFEIISAKQNDKMNTVSGDLEDKKTVPFIGRKAMNNGVSGYVNLDKNSFNEGTVLTIALDGSTGSTFYQHHNFCSGQNIWLLKPKDSVLKNGSFTPVVALYLATTISKAVTEYSYNLSLTKGRLEKIKILLPLNQEGNLSIDEIEYVMSGQTNIEYLYNVPDERY